MVNNMVWHSRLYSHGFFHMASYPLYHARTPSSIALPVGVLESINKGLPWAAEEQEFIVRFQASIVPRKAIIWIYCSERAPI